MFVLLTHLESSAKSRSDCACAVTFIAKHTYSGLHVSGCCTDVEALAHLRLFVFFVVTHVREMVAEAPARRADCAERAAPSFVECFHIATTMYLQRFTDRPS